MIYYDKVTKIYFDGAPPAVADVTLNIEPGEFVSIVGHSGAGKTTMLKMLFAEERPTEGSVFFGSQPISDLPAKELLELRRRIGTVFQDFRLLPTKNVYENIAFALEVAGKDDEEIQADVPHVLELVGLTDKIWNFPHELSGGEQQRVAIARAFVTRPAVLFADEPTGNLDTATGARVGELLFELNAEAHTTLVLVTHDRELAGRCGRVVRMEAGRVL
jgi:cell division transport system ATP-binding protein